LSDEVNLDLANIYQLGVVRVVWASHVLRENNALREALGLPPRQKALAECAYDKDVTNLLSQIDFSSLGEACNQKKELILIVMPFGLTPDAVEEQDCAVDVIGSDSI